MKDKDIEENIPINSEYKDEISKRQIIEDWVNEDEEHATPLNWRNILGGDILTGRFMRNQIKLIILIVFFAIIYISNRYSSQQEQIEIANLKETLKDIKYDALTRSSELTEKSRQSKIEEYLHETGDSMLCTATSSPYAIKKDSAE